MTARQSRGLFHDVRTRTKHAFALLTALSLPAAWAMASAGGNVAEQAKRAIDLVEASAEGKKLAAEPLKSAKSALERAADARATGDKQHAKLLDDLALEWAEGAGDLTRSAALEQKSAELEAKAAELDAKGVRALAIIEEAVARRGRAELELNEQETAAPAPAATPDAKKAPALAPAAVEKPVEKKAPATPHAEKKAPSAPPMEKKAAPAEERKQ